MGAWGASIFSDDLACDIRREYQILLGLGKSNSEAEEMLKDYYSSILDCGDEDEPVFWFALASLEWKYGRLSEETKSKALYFLDSGADLLRWDDKYKKQYLKKRIIVLDELRATLKSPMPQLKKAKKPRVSHCPWRTGSLLAYKVCTNLKYEDHPCFNKYVLLRVILVKKKPVSHLFATELYDEEMAIGLYNWIGSEIPDKSIVDGLEFTPICLPKQNPKEKASIDAFAATADERAKALLEVLNSVVNQVVKCVWLDWSSWRGRITLLGHDESYEDNIPDFFNPLRLDTYTHLGTLDWKIIKRFGPYVGDNPDFDSVVIP